MSKSNRNIENINVSNHQSSQDKRLESTDQNQDHQKFETSNRTGPGPRKISKPETGPDQDQEKFHNLGSDRSVDPRTQGEFWSETVTILESITLMTLTLTVLIVL